MVPPSTKEIGAALGFSLEELDLNRSGGVSSRQLWHHCFSQAAWASFLMLAVAAIAIGLAANWKTISAPMRVVTPVLCAIVMIIAGSIIRDAAANVVTRKVSAAEGPLQFEAQGRGSRMVVGSFKGGSPIGAYKVLTVGATYRVYYLAHSSDFLSIEPVDSPKSSAVP